MESLPQIGWADLESLTDRVAVEPLQFVEQESVRQSGRQLRQALAQGHPELAAFQVGGGITEPSRRAHLPETSPVEVSSEHVGGACLERLDTTLTSRSANVIEEPVPEDPHQPGSLGRTP